MDAIEGGFAFVRCLRCCRYGNWHHKHFIKHCFDQSGTKWPDASAITLQPKSI